MVHVVVPGVDAGPVLAAEAVALRAGEPVEALEARIHAVEHRLLVQTVARFLTRRRTPHDPRARC
ncbi:MAG: formyltransferase family protein [bacterium]